MKGKNIPQKTRNKADQEAIERFQVIKKIEKSNEGSRAIEKGMGLSPAGHDRCRTWWLWTAWELGGTWVSTWMKAGLMLIMEMTINSILMRRNRAEAGHGGGKMMRTAVLRVFTQGKDLSWKEHFRIIRMQVAKPWEHVNPLQNGVYVEIRSWRMQCGQQRRRGPQRKDARNVQGKGQEESQMKINRGSYGIREFHVGRLGPWCQIHAGAMWNKIWTKKCFLDLTQTFWIRCRAKSKTRKGSACCSRKMMWC